MLSLTRREDESFKLYTSDGIVEITVSEVRGSKVRININAPRSIAIARSEIDYTPQKSLIANQNSNSIVQWFKALLPSMNS